MSGESSVRELRATGLQGVSLGETEIALVDGENGCLIYRGHDAEKLAHESTFEATAFLLWNGRLPNDAELSDLKHRAVAGMVVPSQVHDAIRSLGPDALAMDVLRTGLSVWGAMRGRAEGGDSEDALWALAATPAIVADFARLRTGMQALAPDPELGIVENYLLKLTGERPDPAQARALDAYFILGAEHGMNASTFTARVITSTGAAPSALAGKKLRSPTCRPPRIITRLTQAMLPSIAQATTSASTPRFDSTYWRTCTRDSARTWSR